MQDQSHQKTEVDTYKKGGIHIMAKKALNKYSSAFTKQQLLKADKAVTAGEPVRLGQYKVQAQELIKVGSGMLSGQDSAIGRIYADFRDNTASPGAQIEGFVRLSAYDAHNTPKEVIEEFRTEDLRLGANDPSQRKILPQHDLWITEDNVLVLEFIADADGTVGAENTEFIMSMTRGRS